MKTTDRRSFLKSIACAACLCGFSSVFKLAAEENSEAAISSSTNQDISQAEKNEAFALQWIMNLLESLEDNKLSDSQLRSIVKKTAEAHHNLLDVPEMVKPYIGKPDEFISFLEKAWGWKVQDNKIDRLLIVDENKPFCVCPLLKNNTGKLFPALCYCSEGFAEKMFSYVFQHPVSAKVTASVQRGNPSCIYHINY